MSEPATDMPKVLFVRHGETDWNRAGRMQGQRDIPLNDRGRRQAQRNGRIVKGLVGDGGWQVAVSPLGRTRQTLEIILDAGVKAGPVREEDRLKEIAYGEFEGLTHREIGARFPDLMVARKQDKWNFQTPGGESYAQLSDRVWNWLDALREPTLIVAHGGVMRVILRRLGNITEAEGTGLHTPQNQVLSIAPSGLIFL